MPAPYKSGFTLIELLVVISIMGFLMACSVPSLMRSFRAGAVNQTVDGLERLVQQAQLLARQNTPASMAAGMPFYGVALVADGAQKYMTIVYGTALTDELQVAGKPFMRVRLPASVAVYVGKNGGQPQLLTTSPSGWFFQYGTGKPISTASFQEAPINIGTAAQAARQAYSWSGVNFDDIPVSPVCSELSIKTTDQSKSIYFGQLSLGTVFTTEVFGG